MVCCRCTTVEICCWSHGYYNDIADKQQVRETQTRTGKTSLRVTRWKNPPIFGTHGKLRQKPFQFLRKFLSPKLGPLLYSRNYWKRSRWVNYQKALKYLKHPGVNATTKLVKQWSVWPSMNNYCKHWVQIYIKCQQAEVTCHVAAPPSSFS